ncbi:DUF4214 domain-containing protein [Brevundimonas subvibrioides]|uniref:DUF4214 domain-containing protein n=1 Tax=Brevundimonas subvibrioides (strain ATCC 15264 / DSM 4735 / LMG 14903 / NBRC 16000 / CB 81) TaxID=633149 RepID=D9QG44_BRESC|nr:DUF4214 domain-containing protein [Brevundimonas subvibrioides]ADL02586.1 hypothetical protein Bresu_3280 [Brevundimonas subvibrioides ATCC 15264]
MLKKRIKRALRAIGLIKPHQGAAIGKRGLPNQAQARAIVTQLYQIVLKRDPGTAERDGYAVSLSSGELSTPQVVEALIGSGEFGSAFTRHANVAEALSAAVLGNLARVTDDTAIRAYAAGLMGSLPFTDFLREICESPDFRSTWGVGSSSTGGARSASSRGLTSSATVTVPGDLGEMVEGLIAARMIGQGTVLGLPPIHGFERPPIPISHLTALIRTLDMLGDGEGARSRPEVSQPV